MAGMQRRVNGWLRQFERAAGHGEAEQLRDLFTEDALWKDLFTSSKEVVLVQPRTVEVDQLISMTSVMRSVRISRGHTRPRRLERFGMSILEVFLEIDLPTGLGEGILRLEDSPEPRAIELFTALAAIDGIPERVAARRPGLADDGLHRFGEPNWADNRASKAAFLDREPEVLIVGAGQAGLSLAARLIRYGVDVLVVEQNKRVGDNWRHRYHSLRLHNAVPVIGLPYFPIPETWENYLSKDRLADWLEYYANAMDIPVWTSSSLARARRSDSGWDVHLRLADGKTMSVHPKHLVMATGVSGKSRTPSLSGIDEFSGEKVHSSDFVDGSRYVGKRALVVGTGSSGHDIAQDLFSHGVEVTMLQRGSTTVASVVPATSSILDRGFSELPQPDADLTAASFPLSSYIRVHQDLTKEVMAVDADLHAGLRAAGFRLDFGHDNTGVALKYQRQGGGFYLNVGCSDRIISGDIRLMRAENLASFTAKGVSDIDGVEQEIDLVVFATGYEPQEVLVAELLGQETVDRLGPIWGPDEAGYPRNVWRPTAVTGLWFMLGNFQQCRFYSRLLALQIASELRSQGSSQETVRGKRSDLHGPGH